MLEKCEGVDFHVHPNAPKGRGGQWWEECDHIVLDEIVKYETIDARGNFQAVEAIEVVEAVDAEREV